MVLNEPSTLDLGKSAATLVRNSNDCVESEHKDIMEGALVIYFHEGVGSLTSQHCCLKRFSHIMSDLIMVQRPSAVTVF